MIDSRINGWSLFQVEAAINRALQKQAGATDFFQICLQTETGRPRIETIAIPSSCPEINQEKLIRYCAARINNLAMTLGGAAVELRCSNQELAGKALLELETHFPQAKKILSEFHGSNVEICYVPGPLYSNENAKQTFKSSSIQVPAKIAATTVGINIGQTMTKFVVVRDGEELPETRMSIPTWDGHDRSFEKLFDTVIKGVKRLLQVNSLEKAVDAIGIAIGGIVHDGLVTSRSGIASQMSGSDFNKLRNIASLIQERLGFMTLLSQDVMAKANSIRHDCCSQDVLILDIGTSTGGAFIEAYDTIPDYLNQVGRVVIDLSEHAIIREDGQAKGVLSKYLSFTGFKRVCNDYALKGIMPEEMLNLADAGNEVAEIILNNITRTVIEAIIILNRYYNAETVVLTGGFMQSFRFGSRLSEAISRHAAKEGISFPVIKLSKNPFFDGAVGVALMAAARWNNLSSIPLKARSLLQEAKSHKPPQIIANGINTPRQTVMDSGIGRDHYLGYNEDFIKRYIFQVTRDQPFGEAIAQRLIPEMNNIGQVGSLTPQEVQTAAVRTVNFAVDKYDPFLANKQLTNFITVNSLSPVKSLIKSTTQPGKRTDESFYVVFKACLVISALFNALDFFNPKILEQVFGKDFSPSSNCYSGLLDGYIKKILDTPMESLIIHDEFQHFINLISRHPGGSILYFMDNAGEAVVDLCVAELLLNAGFRVTLVAGLAPFVDDITASEIQELIEQSEELHSHMNKGCLNVSYVDSDMSAWGDILLNEWQNSTGYIAKGMRKLAQMYALKLNLSGMHVVLNKSDTVRKIVELERGISLTAEQKQNVILFFSNPDRRS